MLQTVCTSSHSFADHSKSFKDEKVKSNGRRTVQNDRPVDRRSAHVHHLLNYLGSWFNREAFLWAELATFSAVNRNVAKH